MSGNPVTQRLELECGAVMGLRALYFVALLGTTCCIALLPLALPLRFLLFAVTALMAWYGWRQRCELGGEAVTLLWDTEGRWWWRQGGVETELTLCADSYLSSGIVILNFRHPETRVRRSLLLFPGAVGSVLFRRLRVRLALEGGRKIRPGGENLAG